MCCSIAKQKPWVLMSGGFNLTHFILSVQMFPLLQPWSWKDTCCTRNQNSVYYRMTEPADLSTQTRVQKHTHAHTGKHKIHTKSHAREVFMRASLGITALCDGDGSHVVRPCVCSSSSKTLDISLGSTQVTFWFESKCFWLTILYSCKKNKTKQNKKTGFWNPWFQI